MGGGGESYFIGPGKSVNHTPGKAVFDSLGENVNRPQRCKSPPRKDQGSKGPEDQRTRGPNKQSNKGPKDQRTRTEVPEDQITRGPEDQRTKPKNQARGRIKGPKHQRTTNPSGIGARICPPNKVSYNTVSRILIPIQIKQSHLLYRIKSNTSSDELHTSRITLLVYSGNFVVRRVA